jgi:lipopolysaccharide heptosyltransferase II
MEITRENIKSILVVRNDRFGEFLLNIPALRALKETFTNAKIIIVADPYNRELVEAIPFIDEIIEWSQDRHTFLSRLRMLALLKKKKIDLAIMLNPSKEFNIYTYLAGIPRRVGYDRKWGFLLTDKIKDKKYLADKHEVEYNLELVRGLGAKTTDKTLSIKIDDDIIKNLLKEFKLEDQTGLVALHPWTSDPIKKWPTRNFYELANRLVMEQNLKVVIVGSIDNLRESKEFFNDSNSKIINLTGKTTLKQLAVLLEKCKLLISGDSGPVHLAACVGTPVIALFSNNLAGKTAKRWGPWGKGHVVIEKQNLQEITVTEVLDKVREVLRR